MSEVAHRDVSTPVTQVGANVVLPPANEPLIDTQALRRQRDVERRRRRRMLWRSLIGVLLLALVAVGSYQTNKTLPPGMQLAGDWTPLANNDLRVLIDTTTADPFGQRILQQQIFDELLIIVSGARRFIVLDAFLFNSQRGSVSTTTDLPRELSRELRDALLSSKRQHPGISIVVITDPINDVYGAARSPDFALLQSAGVQVVRTDLDRLRDSNPVYSSIWRVLLAWWARPGNGSGAFDNPLAGAPPFDKPLSVIGLRIAVGSLMQRSSTFSNSQWMYTWVSATVR